MSSLKVIASRKYLLSRNFALSIVFMMVFLGLLLVPSCLFFNYRFNEWFKLLGVENNVYPLLYHKIGELTPWVIVCMTALIVINGNTIFYLLTFKDELIEENYRTKKFWFNLITILFFLWIAVSLTYLVIFTLGYSDLNIILSQAKSTVKLDAGLEVEVANLFNCFINRVESYTIIVIVIFILIDILSRIVKNEQLAVIGEKLKNKSVDPCITKLELRKTFRKLLLQKEFVSHQLFMIDIPVLVGIVLILIFTHKISPTIGNDMDAKSIFVAGGIGMHIIMSQVIFLILNLRYKFNEYKLELRSQDEVEEDENWVEK